MSRTLTVECPAIPMRMGAPALVPVKLSGQESINELFEYELLLQTPDALNPFVSQAADFDLDAFIGQPMVCRIELEDGVATSIREINALVTAAEVLGEEGRQVQYRLTLRPWLFLSTLRTDCRIFQDRTVVQILDEVLGGYPYPVVQRLYGPAGGQDERYPPRDYQTQFNESDFAFFSRLCQEWGINYHFEHADGQHRLVLSDATAERKREGVREVPFHAPGWKTDREYLYSAVPVHRLTSGAYATRDHDYRQPRADLAVGRRDPRPTAHAGLEVYQWHAPLAGSHYAQPDADPADPRGGGGQLALLRMQALRTAGAQLRARGAMRGMVPGENFTLQGHPRMSANDQYLILATTFVLEDVGQASQVGAAARDRRLGWRVHVELIAHPVQEVLRPLATQPKPQCAGPQVACVVGPAGQDLWTDDLGRIRVQFPWDRRGREDERSSCWLRVSSPWAGNQLGAIQLPRIGQEVLVDFIGGDPDLPICTGRVANAKNLPPWKLPSQSALSGLRSRELIAGRGNGAGGRSNHLVLDDTAQKIQAQLQSDHACSTLSLGHITRIAGNAGRADERGQGFELRTDAHGAIRAQQGLLVTTEARPNAQGHVLDSGETQQRLMEASALHRSAAEIAQRNKGQAAGDQAEVARLLKAQGDAVRGRAAEDTFPGLAQPHLVLASPAGIATTSQHSTHVASAEHTAITSGKHTSIVSGDSVLAVALRAIKLFAAEQNVQILAAQAEVQIEALKRSIAMAAKEEITLKADRIVIEARSELVVQGSGSYARYERSGIESGTSGSDVRHAATHSAAGPASRGRPSLPAAVKQGLGQMAVYSIYSAIDAGRRGLTGTTFKATDVVEKVRHGVLDAQGKASVAGLAPGGARVGFGKDPRQPWDSASYLGQAAWRKTTSAPAAAPTTISQVGSSMVQAAANYVRSFAKVTYGATEIGATGLVNQAVRIGSGLASIPVLAVDGVDAAVAVQRDIQTSWQISPSSEGALIIGQALEPAARKVTGLLDAARDASVRTIGDGATTVLASGIEFGIESAGLFAGGKALQGFAEAALNRSTAAVADVGSLGSASPDGLAYRLDLPEHLAGPDGFTKSGQLSGTHNLDNATAALDTKGATYTLTPTGTDGISELSYRYAKPTSGKTITGSKTVYDPWVFSDQTMLDYSIKAGQEGWTRYLADPSTTAFDVTHGGVNLRTYINIDPYGTPYVGNVHPIK